jgi:group I intron endonuclease
MLIYSITNLVTGRRYIGATQSILRRRWDAHTKACRDGVKTALYDAMRSYGIESFKIEEFAHLVPGCTRRDLVAVEQQIIAQENVRLPHGYNMTEGGDGGAIYQPTHEQISRNLHSPEARAKAAAKIRGRPLSMTARANISAGSKGKNLGKHHSEDTKRRMSEMRRGCSPDRAKSMHTSEAKAKSRATRSTPEFRLKASLARRGPRSQPLLAGVL